jgi:hypothetical protein
MIRRDNLDNNPKRQEKKASVVIDFGDVLTRGTDGFLDKAVAGSTNIAGLSGVRVQATDANFASNDKITFEQPMVGNEFVADCTAALSQTQIGEYFDLATEKTVNNASAATVKHVKCVGLGVSRMVNGSPVHSMVVEFNPDVVFNS